MSFPPATRKALAYAAYEAHAFGHGVIQPEHLLLGLLQDQSVTSLLSKLRIKPEALEGRLKDYLSRIPEDRPYKARQRVPNQFTDETLAHLGQGAAEIPNATPLRVFIAMAIGEKISFAAELLQEAEVTEKEIKLALTPVRPGGKNLKLYCRNLNLDVVHKEIQPVIGRDAELARIIKTLSRRNKANPLLIGESGVGKSATAKGLAYRIVHQKMPANLQHAQIFSLNIPSLVAKAGFQGEVESRMKGILDEISADENAILLIDDLHSLPSEALEVLKPALESGAVRCLATTNFKHFRNTIQPSHSLARQFLKIDLKEPDVADTLRIVKKSIGQYEAHHDVRYRSDALTAAVKLAHRFIHDKKMPDKVFDILDQVGADKNYAAKSGRSVTAADVERTVSEMTGIPMAALNQDEQQKINLLESDLKAAVMDQDEAARILASSIRRARAGLNDPSKPIGSFLFQGPTGVGKTEITKQLGATLGMKVVRFDMSEYMEKHSISRLIGAPPGYVGFDQAGLLTEAAEKSPHSIILLDEIEKAHPDIYNILLQVMDHGKLTDNNGKQVDFRNTIIVMTTNAGSSEQVSRAMGFGTNAANDNGTQNIDAAIKRLFTPEFRNRLDAIVPFRHLEKTTVLKIADKFLKQLAGRLAERKIEIEWSDDARDWLVNKGYNRNFGARPMARLIQETVANPLADEILGGKLKNGGKVRISFNKAAQGDTFRPPLVFSYDTPGQQKIRRPEEPGAKMA